MRLTSSDHRDVKIIAYLAVFVFTFLQPFSAWLPVGQVYAADIFPLYVTPAFHWSDVGILGLCAAFIFSRAWRGRDARTILLIGSPLLAIALLGFLSVPGAINPSLALYSASRWLLATIVFLFLGVSFFPLRHLAILVTFSAFIQASVACVQAFFQQPLGLPGEMTLELQNHQSAAIYFSGGAWLRSYGLTFHPNVLGGVLAVGIILISLWLRNKWAVLILVVLITGLFFSFSRSSWLAVGLFAPPIWIYLARHDREAKKNVILLLMVGLIAAAVLAMKYYPQLLTRLNPLGQTSEYTSISARGEMLWIALETIQARPITGVGAGNFPLRMQSYPTLDDPQSVHNVPLLLAAEIGLLGAAVWLWLWLFPAFRLRTLGAPPPLQSIIFTVALFAWGLIALWDSFPWALESGRLMTTTLLALTARSFQEAGSAI